MINQILVMVLIVCGGVRANFGPDYDPQDRQAMGATMRFLRIGMGQIKDAVVYNRSYFMDVASEYNRSGIVAVTRDLAVDLLDWAQLVTVRLVDLSKQSADDESKGATLQQAFGNLQDEVSQLRLDLRSNCGSAIMSNGSAMGVLLRDTSRLLETTTSLLERISVSSGTVQLGVTGSGSINDTVSL